MAKGTPFHSRTSALCTSFDWRQWSGYFAPSRYDNFLEPEYHAIRSGAALIDVSPLYKYEIQGTDAVRLVDRLITRDATRAKVGQVLYAPWCDERGKVLQDGTFQRLSENLFRATAADPTLRWFQMNAEGLAVEVREISEEVAGLALQGPRSLEVLKAVTGEDLSGLGYFRIAPARLSGISAWVSRTGFTGDRGYEIWVKSRDAESLWDLLIERGRGHGLQPCGMLALDLARIEAGYPLIEVDYLSAERALIEAQESTPFEIGLGWTVNLKKTGYFVGRETLAAEARTGPSKHFMGLEVGWRDLEPLFLEEGLPTHLPFTASRLGAPVYSGPDQVGKATSSCWSPLLKKHLALATLEGRFGPGARLDLEITVEYKRKRAPARVVKLPFFDPERKRA